MHLSTVVLVLINHQQRAVHTVQRIQAGAVFHVCGRNLCGQDGNKIFHRHGFGKIIALGVITAVILQPLQLFSGLHTLSNNAQLHPTCQIYDKTQDALAGGSCNLSLNKLHIQLQDINRHFRKHIQ